MRRHLLWASLIGLLVAYLSGCAVMATVPPGEVVYEPPVVVEEPAVSVWGWWPWPHYDVEHHYVVEHDHGRSRIATTSRPMGGPVRTSEPTAASTEAGTSTAAESV